MTASSLLGRRDMVARFYQQCERSLRIELDVPPMAETTRLRDELLADQRRPVGASAGERMWVPVVRYDEGYGMTYGLQTALDGVFGGTSQLAVPATWGGERRIGVEGTRSFDGRGVSRVQAGADLRRTEHPAFDVVEERTRIFGRLEGTLAAPRTLLLEAGAAIGAGSTARAADLVLAAPVTASAATASLRAGGGLVQRASGTVDNAAGSIELAALAGGIEQHPGALITTREASAGSIRLAAAQDIRREASVDQARHQARLEGACR
jgi:hypothetical protein